MWVWASVSLLAVLVAWVALVVVLVVVVVVAMSGRVARTPSLAPTAPPPPLDWTTAVPRCPRVLFLCHRRYACMYCVCLGRCTWLRWTRSRRRSPSSRNAPKRGPVDRYIFLVRTGPMGPIRLPERFFFL